MRRAIVSLVLTTLAAPLAAAPAKLDIDNHPYCSSDTAGGVYQKGDGYRASLGVSWVGDTAHARYPAGSQPLFGGGGELRPYISSYYHVLFDKAGRPLGRPFGSGVSMAMGRFAVTPPAKADHLTIQVVAGDYTSRAFPVSDSSMSIADPGRDIGPPGSENPYDFELSQEDYDALVYKLETAPDRWLVLLQDGREIARIPVPQRDLMPERNVSVAWLQKTMPLILKGQCPD